MKFTIRNRYVEADSFIVEADSFIKAIEQKVKDGANLTGADLTGANLTGADLTGADLTGADLTHTYFQVSHVLHSCNWGDLPDNLTLELMRRDAVICGNDLMQQWADGGNCPFSGYIYRDFYFTENRDLWIPGPPEMNDMELFKALCETKGIKL